MPEGDAGQTRLDVRDMLSQQIKHQQQDWLINQLNGIIFIFKKMRLRQVKAGEEKKKKSRQANTGM